MKKQALLQVVFLFAALALSACKEEAAQTSVSEEGVAISRADLPGDERFPYHASSDIDGWHLSVTQSQLILDRGAELGSLELPTPKAELLTGGYQYRLPTTPKVTTIVIRHVGCRDSAGNAFADTVEIDDAAGKSSGCGAPVGQTVQDTVVQIGPAPVLENIK